MNLAAKKCVACEGGIPPLSGELLRKYFNELKGAWTMADEKNIARDFVFKDFNEAVVFVNAIAELAESEGHHPDITIRYNKVRLELTTHAIGGLSENDFILAAKINGVVANNAN
jgi:4a-hydroxytetrahydrobiopterin dehydratase